MLRSKKYVICSKSKYPIFFGNNFSRNFSIFTILREALKIRYLFFASAAGGTYYLQKKTDEIKRYFPDLGFFELSNSQKETIYNAAEKLKENIPDLDKLKTNALANAYESINYKYVTDMVKSLSEFKPTKKGNDGSKEKASELVINMDNVLVKQISPEEEEHQKKMKIVEEDHTKEIIKLEEELEGLKRQLLLRQHKRNDVRFKIKKSLIEMYSDVLDALEKFDGFGSAQDQLPRIVVVGEQSAGKTSVLEMVAEARLFPRGAGSMMTRTPVKVTLAEGPFSVAQFEGDDVEYDLNCPKGLLNLRSEIEGKMNRSVINTESFAKQQISLSVKGPNLNRAVLIDLPGIINTTTGNMEPKAKESVINLAKQYLSNPNSIILCILDASKDAESSNVVDLVSSLDPNGKRTIVVLTKIDLAESQLSNPKRIKDILTGKVYNMKALGYYAVIAGKGKDEEDISKIKQYEEEYFRNSKLLSEKSIKFDNLTTKNLSKAVSELFWKMVKESVETQLDRFRALKSNLENEWRHKYKGHRELDRMELFEKARNEILDSVINLSVLSPTIWEDNLYKAMWNKISHSLFEKIYFPSHEASESYGEYKTTLENCLHLWVNEELGLDSVSVGWESLWNGLQQQLQMLEKESKNRKRDEAKLFIPLHQEMEKRLLDLYKWDNKALSSLRILQNEALHDVPIRSVADWNSTISFLITSLDNYVNILKKQKDALKGPSLTTSWLKWTTRSELQKQRSAVFDETDKILNAESNHKISLTPEEIVAIKSNLQMKKISVTEEFIKDTWRIAYREKILERAKLKAVDCKKGYYHYQYGYADEVNFDCRDVLFFFRIERMLQSTSSSLRNQIMNNEVQRLDKIVKEILADLGSDPSNLSKLIIGDRVKLAEDIKLVNVILEQLEEFIGSLNKEKS